MGAADWDRVKAAVPIGAEVSGRVVACQPFGVFVDLGLGFPGLLEVPEFGDATARSRGMEGFPAVGVVLTAGVLQHMDHDQQLRLTQRPLTAEQWEQARGWVQGWGRTIRCSRPGAACSHSGTHSSPSGPGC